MMRKHGKDTPYAGAPETLTQSAATANFGTATAKYINAFNSPAQGYVDYGKGKVNKSWNSLSALEKKAQARYMEIYAGMVDNLDYNIGLLIRHLKDIGEYDNTFVDVAIRSGTLYDNDLIARPLQPARMLAVASQAYLARFGVPVHPSDLARHNCLAFGAWGPNHAWRFTQGDDTVRIPVQGSFVSNNGQALLSAALAGMGIVVQTDTLLESYVRSGQLSVLMPDWELPSRALHIVRRPETRPSAKVRSFVDFVLDRLG